MTRWPFEVGKALEDWATGHIPVEIFGVEIPAPRPSAY